MRSLIFLLPLLLAACAQSASNRTEVWKDLWRDENGQARTKEIGDRDRAQCDYEWRRTAALAPETTMQFGGAYGQEVTNMAKAMSGPGPELFYSCMRARGWQFIGYQ